MLSNENREGSAVTSPQAESQDRSARRTTVKLDADKLLSTPGLPRLRHESSKLRFKGKGHEAADLQKLMTYYQIWGHGLFPKLKFESFVEKTESVCRQKRMKIFLDAVLAEERRRRYNNGASADEEYEMKIEDKDRIRDGMDYDEPPDGKISEDATQASAITATPVQSQSNTAANSNPILLSGSSSTINADVLARIAQNKARALAKLAERQRQRDAARELEAAEKSMQDDLEVAQELMM